MEDSSIILGQTMLEVLSVLLLTLVTVYVYLSCRTYARGAQTPQGKPGVSRQSMLPRMNLPAGEHSGRALWEKHKASIADWLAPLLVWVVVLWTLLAVVGILLGEN